jgi:tetratricopeptide (TPR) repeat protein
VTPLLARIESELQDCVEPVRRTDLMAERACYLARSGDAAEANRIATELRSYSGRSNPRVMLWVMIIEALVLHFSNLSSSSEDRMNRAFVLCSSLGIADLADLSSAWLSRFKFDRSEFTGMAKHLAHVLGRMAEAPDSAVMRAAIVAADAFRFAGLDQEAQGWYECARSLALKVGDRTAVGAIMYNRAAMGLAELSARCDASGEEVDQDRLRLLFLEIESAASFQTGTQVTSLVHLTRLCQARALMLAGRWEEASVFFESLAQVIRTAEDRPNRPDVNADLAWCWLHIGRQSEAIALLSEISMQSAEAMDIDDQVTYLSRLIQLRQRLGMESPTLEEHTHFRAVCDAYLKHIELLRAELEPLSPARCNLQPFNS